MACLRLRLAYLMVFGLVQHSKGGIIELKNFHSRDSEPMNDLEVDINSYYTITDGLPHRKVMESLHQMSKRQNSPDQPRVDGEHMFEDGYNHGRIHYSGNNSDVIFVLTYDLRNNIPNRSNLYRSTDYGASFININSLVDNSTLYQTFFSSDLNMNLLIFAHASESRLYYTLDEGVTFIRRDLIPNTLNPRSIKYHPTRDGWMVALDSDNSLYVTKDYAADWTQVAPNVSTFQWADEKWDDNTAMVYYTIRDPENVNLTVNLYTSAYPFTEVTEFDTNLGDHDGFLLMGPYIFAQRTDNDVVGLYVSYDRQPFQKALIPTPYAHQRYLVTHIDEMQALVIVEHEGGFYNLYLSDESGVYFSLSLRDIVVEDFYTLRVDLELIQGVNGTLIANQYTREDVSQSKSLKRTLITLDNGGFWELVLPPDEDVDGVAINCEPPDCSLHFHMDTSAYARLGVYSSDSAPGIIVAHGSVGEQLSNNPNLYISRDGGVTWEETLAGSWGVNLADHGGLMVAARDYHHDEESTELMYTCNEGYSWQSFNFTDTAITVFGVITEPGKHTTIVSLYGGEWRSGSFMWVEVTVEFSPIFQQSCDDGDYYDWMPWDERSDTDCILGSTVTIERRKPQICCLNGRDYDREFNFTICECNSEDFECDYGYARPGTDLTGSCMRDPDVTLTDPCASGKTETYTASTGYRKIAGDVCHDGVESLYSPFQAPCCENSTLPPTPRNPTDITPSSSTSSTSSSTSTPSLPSTTSKTTKSSSVPSTSSTSSSSDSLTSSSSVSSSSDSSTRTSSSSSSKSSTGSRPSPSVDTITKESTVGISRSVAVAMGVVLILVCIAAVVILALCVAITIKHRILRQKYIRLATAGEPDLQRYTSRLEREDSLEQLTPFSEDPERDDDDLPLVP